MERDDQHEAWHQAEQELRHMMEDALSRIEQNKATEEDVTLMRFACGLGKESK